MISLNSAGTPGMASMGGTGTCSMCADMIWKSLSPPNGRRPVTISYNTIPNE
jgi:hypothetical protein